MDFRFQAHSHLQGFDAQPDQVQLIWDEFVKVKHLAEKSTSGATRSLAMWGFLAPEATLRPSPLPIPHLLH
jgi:hypothetical protein